MELADQVAAADEPDVAAVGGRDHLGVHRGDVALHEADVGAGDRGELAVAEDPGRPVGVNRCQRSGWSSSDSWSRTHW